MNCKSFKILVPHLRAISNSRTQIVENAGSFIVKKDNISRTTIYFSYTKRLQENKIKLLKLNKDVKK